MAIPDRATFQALSSHQVFVKFILFGMDTNQPRVYFMNTETREFFRGAGFFRQKLGRSGIF